MKKKGNVCEFTSQRDAEMWSCFRKILGDVKLINLSRIFAEVASSPASRFFVSEDRAAVVIRYHLRHGEWNVKGAQRIRMFSEIESRVLEILQSNPGTRFEDAVYDAVNSPAPGFFLTPRSCRTILYNYVADGGGRR